MLTTALLPRRMGRGKKNEIAKKAANDANVELSEEEEDDDDIVTTSWAEQSHTQDFLLDFL